MFFFFFYDSNTKSVKWLHHWFPSVHISVADRTSHNCKSPPGGAMIQSNNEKRNKKTQTKNREDTTQYSLTGSVKYKKKKRKKLCINRHIIKYNVITEHIFIHGVAMETDFWRVRDASSDPSRAPRILWPLIGCHYLACWQGATASSVQSAQSIQTSWTADSKVTRAKNIKSSYQRGEPPEREMNDRESCLPSQVLKPFVANV